MIDLTTLANALIALLAAVITAFVIPWIRSKTTAQQRELLEAGHKIAAFAAEQLFGAGHGAEKKEYAAKWLQGHGYTVDFGLLEATVKEYFGHWDDDATEDEAEEDAPGVEDEHPPEE